MSDQVEIRDRRLAWSRSKSEPTKPTETEHIAHRDLGRFVNSGAWVQILLKRDRFIKSYEASPKDRDAYYLYCVVRDALNEFLESLESYADTAPQLEGDE